MRRWVVVEEAVAGERVLGVAGEIAGEEVEEAGHFCRARGGDQVIIKLLELSRVAGKRIDERITASKVNDHALLLNNLKPSIPLPDPITSAAAAATLEYLPLPSSASRTIAAETGGVGGVWQVQGGVKVGGGGSSRGDGGGDAGGFESSGIGTSRPSSMPSFMLEPRPPATIAARENDLSAQQPQQQQQLQQHHHHNLQPAPTQSLSLIHDDKQHAAAPTTTHYLPHQYYQQQQQAVAYHEQAAPAGIHPIAADQPAPLRMPTWSQQQQQQQVQQQQQQQQHVPSVLSFQEVNHIFSVLDANGDG